ncbi:HET-domain-containing protein [Tothia fuscella]|uniref:HET-domain-containing protein n=1 Tax=Tothia fuscella TaxID=1048955 RepID=A0A9P4NVJ7_9PEZI|nr:HET-domain-containing protein [Tothia fuscella]
MPVTLTQPLSGRPTISIIIKTVLTGSWSLACYLIDGKSEHWVQLPRFRRKRLNPEKADSEGHVSLHHLCERCETFFRKSKLLCGSWYPWIPNTETRLLQDSLAAVRLSVEDDCHFCTLLLEHVQKYQSGEILSNHQECWITITTAFGDWGDDYALQVSFGAPLSRADIRADSPQMKPLALNVRDPSCTTPSRYDYGTRAAPSLSFSSTGSPSHFDLARYWLDGCSKYHAKCNQIASPATPTRLLDVGTVENPSIRLRLCGSASRTLPYLILSHCWGGADNILKLKKENTIAFQFAIDSNSLPKTFQDAVEITRNLGVGYLWIDSLCIIQDSKSDWTQEAASMDKYYENAKCTIANASAGNPHEGCYSSRNPLKFARCHVVGSKIQGRGVYALPVEMPSDEKVIPQLSTRAWVFQEEKLSPRTLTYGKTGIEWRCKFGIADESDMNGTGTSYFPGCTRTTQGPLFGHDEWNRLWSHSMIRAYDFKSVFQDGPGRPATSDIHSDWFQLVYEYSKRNLSRPSDKLIAFSGLAKVVKETTGGKYLAGLWKESLRDDLIWRVLGPLNHRPTDYRAPSWSWASVEGIITSPKDISRSGRSQFFGLDSKSTTKTLSKVVSIQVRTAPTDSAGTGQVFDGGMVLVGPTKQIQVSSMGHRLDTWKRHWNEKYFTDSQNLRYFPDSSDLASDDAVLMPIRKVINQNDNPGVWEDDFALKIEGLVLVSTPIGYTRIGMFMLCSRHFDQAVADWFQDCASQTIVIK